MLRLCLSALAFGLLGALAVPIIAFFGALALFYGLDPRCGTPGDSGGCAMSASLIGFASLIPGFLIGAVWGIYRARRKRGGWSEPGQLGASEAVLDCIRAWAAGTAEVQRLWLYGFRAGGRHRIDSPVHLAVEVRYWDSPDRGDQGDAYASWYYNQSKWREQLVDLTSLPIKLRALTREGGDGTMQAVPKGALLIYEREPEVVVLSPDQD